MHVWHVLHVSTASDCISPPDLCFPCRLILCAYEWTTDRSYHGYTTNAIQERGVACCCISFANIGCVSACVPKIWVKLWQIFTTRTKGWMKSDRSVHPLMRGCSAEMQPYSSSWVPSLHLWMHHIPPENKFNHISDIWPPSILLFWFNWWKDCLNLTILA